MEKKKKRLTITLAESVLDDLEKMAKEKGLSKSALITIALGEYKKGHKKRAPREKVRSIYNSFL